MEGREEPGMRKRENRYRITTERETERIKRMGIGAVERVNDNMPLACGRVSDATRDVRRIKVVHGG